MRSAALATLAIALRTVPAAAQETPPRSTVDLEEQPPPSGMRIAMRTGFAVPLGSAFESSGAMAATMTGQVPLRVDIGYRVARSFYAGAFGQIGMIIPKACPSGWSCSSTSGRIGVMAAYHFRSVARIDPWLGLGMGFEILDVSRSNGTSGVDISMRGLELLNMDLGVDVRATGALRLGPVLSTSMGRFTSITVDGTSTNDFDASTHVWVMLGLRGAYDL